MRAALIVNASSRQGREWAPRLESMLRERGVQVDLALFPGHKRLYEAGVQARDRRLPLVIIGGGDGTISALARHFVHTDTVVGVIPLGTGNAMARDLELPNSIPEACDVVASGEACAIDLGFASNDYFVNVVTAGVSTLIARSLNPSTKRRFGKLAYLGAIIRAFRRAKPFNVRLELDGEQHTFDTLQVVIGNGRFHAGPLPLSESASLVDGWLTVYALQSTKKKDMLELAHRLVKGNHSEMANLVLGEFRSGRVESTPSVRVTMDGEVSLRTPFDFRVEPKALTVLVPKKLAV